MVRKNEARADALPFSFVGRSQSDSVSPQVNHMKPLSMPEMGIQPLLV